MYFEKRSSLIKSWRCSRWNGSCQRAQPIVSGFGLGTMIYNGLELGTFFEIPWNSPCYQVCIRVTRWFIFKPKIPIWEYFRGP
jgi:hypothetical protein